MKKELMSFKSDCEAMSLIDKLFKENLELAEYLVYEDRYFDGCTSSYNNQMINLVGEKKKISQRILKRINKTYIDKNESGNLYFAYKPYIRTKRSGMLLYTGKMIEICKVAHIKTEKGRVYFYTPTFTKDSFNIPMFYSHLIDRISQRGIKKSRDEQLAEISFYLKQSRIISQPKGSTFVFPKKGGLIIGKITNAITTVKKKKVDINALLLKTFVSESMLTKEQIKLRDSKDLPKEYNKVYDNNQSFQDELEEELQRIR